jgi:hypothetical protein
MEYQSSNFRLSLSEILFAVFVWSLLILRFGYRFGTGDQVELLPYTLFLHDPTLYAHDFFIQGLHAAVPNERTVAASLLLPFVNHLEVFCFIFQFLSTVTLITGLSKLAIRFIRNRYLAWTAVLITVLPLNDFALGNVELYSECFQASGLAVAIVVWTINLFLDRKYLWASALMSLATIIQLLDGLDVMLVLSAVLFVAVLQKEVSVKVFFQFILLYTFTAGVYLIMIFIKKSGAADITNSQVFMILFEYRNRHHFIFSSFPKIKTTAFFFLTIVSIPFFARRSKALFHFILLGLAGLLVYAICVDGFHNVFIGNFQFYKISPWMKFLGVVGLIGTLKFNAIPAFKLEKPMLITFSILCWIVILNFSDCLPYKVPFQIFSMKEKDPMISICEKIKQSTSSEAVFIQPFETTELKFYAQRSSYVEFKANIKNKRVVLEWWRRLTNAYGLSLSSPVQGFMAEKAANSHFYHLSAENLATLKQEGVTHILTRKEFPPTKGSLILQNNTYAVYQL